MTAEGGDSEAVDALTKRGELLAALCDGPAEKRALVEKLDLSRSTLDRAVRELEAMNLVDRDGSTVVATAAGRLAVDTLGAFESTLSDVLASDAVLNELPLDAPITRQVVHGSESLLAEEPVPHRPLERFHDALADAERYRAVLPVLDDPRQIRLLYEHVVTEGNPAELVVSPELLEAFQTEFPRRMTAMAETGEFDVVVGDTPPFAFAIVADESGNETVFVVVFTDSGSSVHGVLVNETSSARRWATDEYAQRRADGVVRTDTLVPDSDTDDVVADPDGGAVRSAIGRSLPSALEREGFVRLATEYFREEPVADPTTAWRAGLSIPEVHTGYAIDRTLDTEQSGSRAMTATLVDDLLAGVDSAVIGPPGAGKSTVCKRVACAWYDADHGPVLYREQGRGRPFHSVDDLVVTVDAADGHTLVVVEDAVRPETETIFEAIDRLNDREDVSFLLDARESEWRESTGAHRHTPDLSVLHAPPLADSDVERLVEHFERTVGESVDVPVERLRQAVRDETAEGTAPNELLLLLHRLVSYADPLAAGRTSLEDSVADVYDAVCDDEVTLDVCVLANTLNAAGVGFDAGLLYAVADPDEYDAVDAALDRLSGRVLFAREDGSYRTVHEAWSVAFLAHVEAADDRATDRFGRCVSRLLALAGDPAKRESIVRHCQNPSTLAAVATDPGEWAEETAEMVYAMGRKQPVLAPLFGDGADDSIDLPSVCSAATVDRRAVWLGELFLSAGHYDRAEQAFEQLPDDESEFGIERLVGLAKVDIARSDYADGRDRAAACLDIVDEDDHPFDAARAHLKLGHALQRLDDYETAASHFRAALDGFQAVGDRRWVARTLTGFGRIARRRGQTEQARSYLQRSLDIASERGDRHGQMRALNDLGRVAMDAGEYEAAREYYERSLERSQTLGKRSSEANALNNIGMVCNMLGEYEAALEYCERSLDIKRDLGNRQKVANTYSTLGIVAASNGDHERARDYFEQAADIKREVGDRLGEAMARNNLGNVACRQCEYDAARTQFEQSLETKRELGARQGLAESHINLAEVARRRGRYERAQATLEQALAVAQEVDDQHSHAQALDRLGAVAHCRGDHDQARDHLEEALDIAETVGDRGLTSTVRCRLGDLDRSAGDSDRARERLDQAIEDAETGGDSLDTARARLARGRLALACDDHDQARELATATRETFADLGADHFTARSQRLLGRVAAASGDDDAARDSFVDALETFEDVGAPQDVLSTLECLIDLARHHDDGAALRRWHTRLEACVADAPDATLDAHSDWLAGRPVEVPSDD